MDDDKPLSSAELIKQARQDLHAAKDDILPSSEEMARTANETPTPTEIEKSLAADLAALGETKFEAEGDSTTPDVDFAPPQPARPRQVSRGDHTPANVDGPVEATPPPQRESPSLLRFWWLIPVVLVGVSLVGTLFEDTGTSVTSAVVTSEATTSAIFAGDCLDDGSRTIDPTDIKDCAEAHDFEIFGIVSGAPDSDVGDECVEVFEDYVGIAYFESELWLTFLPLEGSEPFACLVYESPDLGESVSHVTGTLRDSNR